MFSVLQRREAGLSSPTKLYDAAKGEGWQKQNKVFVRCFDVLFSALIIIH